MRSTRIRILLLFVVVALVGAFGVRHFEVEAERETAPIHSAYASTLKALWPNEAKPPPELAKPPSGAEPGEWWEDTHAQARHDGTLLTLLGLVLVAALLNAANPGQVRRLRTSVICYVGYAITVPVGAAFLSSSDLALYGHVRLAAGLLRGVAVLNLAAILVLHVALHLARVRVPRIIAEVIVAASYVALAFWLFSRDGADLTSLVATSAVLTAVIGLSLQDTLGNILGGLLLEIEDTINVGDWIRVGDVEGCVRQIRWRQTTLETRNWDEVILPNSVIMKSQIKILGRRDGKPVPGRRWVWFSVELSVPPTTVIDAVEQALRQDPIERVARDPKAHCILMDFKDGCCVYAVRYWLTDLAVDDPTDSVIRQRLFFALKRAGLRLAFPAHSISLTEEDEERRAWHAREELRKRREALGHVEMFKVLDPKEVEEIAGHLRHAPFAKGEVMTRQGAAAHWLYVIVSGTASVHVSKDGLDRKVGELGPGDVFGEMALLTGQPRSATVVADSAVDCWRLEREGFEDVIRRRPEIARELSRILALRKSGLDAARETLERDATRLHNLGAMERDILSQITRFFGLQEDDDATKTRAGL